MDILFIGNLGSAEILVLLFVFVIPLVLWIIAIVDLVKRQFKDQTTKIIWALVIIFVPFIGSILYLLIGRKGGVK